MSALVAATSILIPRLVASNSVFLVCDIQERFRPIIHRYDTVISKSALLYQVSSALGIPCIMTEQNPKALGHTVSEISSLVGEGSLSTKVFEKKQFSMTTPEVSDCLSSLGKKQVILCGIEAHVCVLQSTMDLLSSGYQVFVMCDAVSSSRYTTRISFQF